MSGTPATRTKSRSDDDEPGSPSDPSRELDLLPLFASAGDPRFDAGLVCHFAGRTGGVSEAPYDTLNVSFSSGDDPARVVENRQRIAKALDAPLDQWVVPGQVHGVRVLELTKNDSGNGARAPSTTLEGADILSSRTSGVFGLALGADCPLVAIASADPKVVVVAHVGWRGTVEFGVREAAREFERLGGDPTGAFAAVSPGISGVHYPVGPEVHEACRDLPGYLTARVPQADPRGGRGLDLRSIHRAQLVRLGIDPSRIHVSPHCTFEATGSGGSATTTGGPPRYFSHRRDGAPAGRNGLVVGWR